MTRRCSTRRGFTLVDLTMAVAVIGIVLLAVLPTTGVGEPMRLIGLSARVVADIEAAQTLTLASPSDPTVVVFDQAAQRYWLALQSDPATPIATTSGDAWVVDLSPGSVAGGETGIDLAVTTGPRTTLVFDDFGRLLDGADFEVRLGNSTGDVFVQTSASTGSVRAANATLVPPEPPAPPLPPQNPGGGGGGFGSGGQSAGLIKGR
ncbi:MAG: hypothetical protein AAGD00_00210 [Planctomycetota bacterium]